MELIQRGLPRSPTGGATGPPVARGGDRPPAAPVGWAQRSPEGRATGPPCRPLGGDRPPLFFYSRDFVANLKKKLHLNPVALWEDDRGIFLKFSKTDIYF